MQASRHDQQSDSARSPGWLLLSIGLPVGLLLAFLGKQFVNFDSIGWSHGFSHPLMGWDHLITMLAVGVWAAQLRGQAIWMLPLAFVGVMSLGGLAGAAGLAIPSVEGIILLSCAVFSILITRKVRFSSQINVLIVAFFAFFHGYAHGQEISTSASLISYTLGFMLATLLLHGAGILVAKLVVFCVTCLLTAMFANAALAKSAESIREDNQPPAAAFVHDAANQKNLPFWVVQANGELKHHACLLEQQRSHAANSECCGDALRGASSGTGGHTATDLKLPINTSQFGDKTDTFQLLAKVQPVQTPAICQDRAMFDGYHLVDAGLDFKHYYRDVNHTPGKHLSSNGVGLTSPPVSHVSAPQAIQNLRITPIPSIEDQPLQSTFAKVQSGNRHSTPIKQPGQNDAVRNRSAARQSAYAGFSRQKNIAAYLTPDDKPYFTYNGATSAVSAPNSLSASRNNLPLNVPEKAPSLAFTQTNITIKIREKFEP